MRADEVLQFTERGIAKDIRKVLASAVANATNPDNTGSYIADADELFVLACFADEGPTLRRFRPRARGRATRIRKRTCHITVVVARMSEQRLEVVQARAEGSSANDSAKRRARVERSRTRAQAAKAAVEVRRRRRGHRQRRVERRRRGRCRRVDARSRPSTWRASPTSTSRRRCRRLPADERCRAGEFAAGEWAGSVLPDADGNGPDTHLIKGNADSMLYHTPDSRYYKVTKAEVWFDTEENAEAAGFSKPGSQADDAETENN